MTNYEIQMLLMNALPLEEVHVSSDSNHFHVIAVGQMFADMSCLKKQQTVYAPLMQLITEQHIHAVSIRTYTPKEWANNHKMTAFS